MIYPDVPLEKWIEKYGLSVHAWTCWCGEQFKTTVPILLPASAGLQTPVHECGEHAYSVVLTPRTEESKAFWRTII